MYVGNVFSVTPLNYEVDIQALSHEKLSVKIQSSLTIGPNIDSPENLRKYVKLLVSSSSQSNTCWHFTRLISRR